MDSWNVVLLQTSKTESCNFIFSCFYSWKVAAFAKFYYNFWIFNFKNWNYNFKLWKLEVVTSYFCATSALSS